MKLFRFRKHLLCLVMIMALSLPVFGTGYAADGGVEVSLTSPASHQVFKPGDKVEIRGTAQGLAEVSVAVRSGQGILLFTAQPKVADGVFSTGFTLDSGAADGKYTIYVGSLGLPEMQKYYFEVSSADAGVTLTKPSAGAGFNAGEVVEIAGTAQNVSGVLICVRNSKNGRVFMAQPPVVDGSFTTQFTLGAEAVGGEYTIAVSGGGLAADKTSRFTVTSTGDNPGGVPDEPDDPDAILFINGSGVTKKVSFSRAELEAMDQEREVFSATSDYPENLIVAAEGVPLRTLLEQAGMKWGAARMISFAGSDGYTAQFTVDELLNQPRYIFPGQIKVEPIIALKRSERSSSFDSSSEQDTPVLCYGQRARTEQTLMWFVKRLETITVTTGSPGKWSEPTAKIIAPGSSNKVATQGGQVESGSKIYLECEPVAKTYYTTDDNNPNLDSNIFNLHGCGPLVGKDDPIILDKDTTVKAKAVGRGKRDSDVVAFEFKVTGGEPAALQEGVPTGAVPQQVVDEKNIIREELTLENGRKRETITFQEGILDDIDKGVRGSRLTVTSIADVDEVVTELSAAALQKAQVKGMLLGINSAIGNYTLPLESLNLEEIAAGLGSKPEELSMHIVISRATEDVKNKLAAQVRRGQAMLVGPVEFTIEFTGTSGKRVEYRSFGKTYVERELALDGDVNVRQATGVVWSEAENGFFPLPTLFENRDGKNYAVILNRTNSLYTVLQSSKTFSDIQNNWAKENIELLADKMLISGKTETTYEPDSNITRAEFATLLVRALGLKEGVLTEGQFKDVAGTDWYAGSVAAATKENIIAGYDGNLFKPNDNITREEMAAMIIRAERVAGKEESMSADEQEQQLAQFKDSQSISTWAARDVALAARAGIIKGMPGGEFSPQTNADRAQSATMMKQFLTYVNFVSETAAENPSASVTPSPEVEGQQASEGE